MQRLRWALLALFGLAATPPAAAAAVAREPPAARPPPRRANPDAAAPRGTSPAPTVTRSTSTLPLQGLGAHASQRPATLVSDPSLLRFEPRTLQLRGQRTCVPRWEQVEVLNTGDREIVIEAVSSDHNMFHPSLTKPESLKRNEATRLQVLFLAQAVGQFEGLVFVQTSLGVFPYTVKATAVENPYKVEPIIGAKVVVGERFSPPLALFNPRRDVALHVREVFTTEAFLHLALPDRPGDTAGRSIGREAATASAAQLPSSGGTTSDGEGAEAAAGVWTIPTRQQRTVIHVSFLSHTTGRFRGFVHVKTDLESLLVPVEVLVTRGGVHVSPELVDFQTLVSPLQARSLWLTLTNLNPRPIELLSLYDPKQDPSLQITGFEQKGVGVPPGASVRFARVTYHGGQEGLRQGKLQLIVNDTDAVSATLDIPYRARVLYGSLGFVNDKTKFQSTPGRVTSTLRSIVISNNFSVPILIHTAKIDDPSFQITHFTPNSLLVPGDAVSLMNVEFTSNGSSALYTRDLELTTNVTAMKIPLQVYHGRLHCQMEHDGLKECSSSDLDLDMGTISVTESRRKQINITNLNPVNVTIEGITFSHVTVNLYMDGVWGPRGEQIRGPRPVPRNLQSKRILTLPPFHRLSLSVEVVAMDAGVTSTAVTIGTRRKENIVLLVRYESVLGSLAFLPATIRFEAAFPGRVQSRVVAARSTFERPLHIRAVRSTDSRIIPQLLARSLSPLARTEIARVHYDPSKASSPEESYMPQSDEVEWDVPLTEEVVERWARRQKSWDDLGTRGQTDIEATLLFDTNIVRGASLTVRAFLTQPSVVGEPSLGFELTQVGTSVARTLRIHNPSDAPLAVQLVFPLCEGGLQGEAGGNASCDLGFRLAPEAQQVLHVRPHAELAVGPVSFEPQQHAAYNATLYVRNNLTLLQPVRLSGVGGSGRLVFPRGALDFNLTAEDLGGGAAAAGAGAGAAGAGAGAGSATGAGSAGSAAGPGAGTGAGGPGAGGAGGAGASAGGPGGVGVRPGRAVTKSFVATNDCELPVEVLRLDINGVPGCAAFGFEVHDCRPFVVAPHESVAFKVSFTPDFAASRWEQRLRLHTQSGVLAVPLRAFVPQELLPRLADGAPFLGESEASVQRAVAALAVLLCLAMFLAVLGDCARSCRAVAPRGETLSLLSWPGVGALAPPTGWGAAHHEALLPGAGRGARRPAQQPPQPPQQYALQHAPQQPVQQHAPPAQHAPHQQAAAPEQPEAGAAPRAEAVEAAERRAAGRAAEQQRAAAAAAPGPEEARARAADGAERRRAAEELERQARAAEEQRRADERRRAQEREAAAAAAPAGAQAAAPAGAQAAAPVQVPAAQRAEAGGAARGKRRGRAEPPAPAPAPAPAQREERDGRRREAPAQAPDARARGERQERPERRARDERPEGQQREERQERPHGREERSERQPREEREAASQEERAEWQQREERERHAQQRDAREKRGQGSSSEQHAERRGAAAEAAPAPSPKRREAHAKRREGQAPAAPAKAGGGGAGQGGQQPGGQQGGRGARSAAAAALGPGPLQGSVWADPRPAFQPQAAWALDAARGALPPPPSVPPPPAPRAKGAAARAEAQRAAAKHGGRPQNAQRGAQELPPPPPRHAPQDQPALADASSVEQALRAGALADRVAGTPLMAPIGPVAAPSTQRPAASLLPDQEFIPINTESPSLDRMQVFGDTPFAASLFSSPFAMFGPVTSHSLVSGYGESAGGTNGSGLLADLHADSQPVENAAGRHKSDSGSQLV